MKPFTDISITTAIKAINDSEYCYSTIQEAIGVLRINLNDTLARDIDTTKYKGYDVCTEYYNLKDGILGLRGVCYVHATDIWDPVWDEVRKQKCVAFEGKRLSGNRYVPKQDIVYAEARG
jgi:hypothetical protein